MKKFQQLFIIMATLLIVGAGCDSKLLNKLDQKENTYMISSYPYKELSENFCDKQRQKAEQETRDFKLVEDKKIAYEVWKKSFLKFNNITEDFFKAHIYITRISENNYSGSYTIYSISYYYKVGDIYLYSSNADQISVNKEWVKSFENGSVDELLKSPIEVVDKLRETHPTFGRTPNSAFLNYTWGRIGVNNIKAQPTSALSCADAVAMLKNCHSDMSPVHITYKGLLGQAWLEGKAGEWGEEDLNDCASASLNLFSEKFNSCHVNVSCSAIIN